MRILIPICNMYMYIGIIALLGIHYNDITALSNNVKYQRINNQYTSYINIYNHPCNIHIS